MSEKDVSASSEERARRVIKVSDVPIVNLMPGANSHIVPGTNMTLSFVTLQEKQYYPVHSHPHEQMIIVLKGELDVIVEGKKYRLGVGDVLPIGGGLAHGAHTLDEQCVVLEVFSPARIEFEEKLRSAIDSDHA